VEKVNLKRKVSLKMLKAKIKLDNEDSKNEEEEYKQKQNANLHRDPGNKAVSHTPDVVKTLEPVVLNQEPNPQNSPQSKFPH